MPKVDFRDARYECLSCNHTWVGRPGTVMCPKCHHLYVKWANYEACATAYHGMGHSPIEANAFGGSVQKLGR